MKAVIWEEEKWKQNPKMEDNLLLFNIESWFQLFRCVKACDI